MGCVFPPTGVSHHWIEIFCQFLKKGHSAGLGSPPPDASIAVWMASSDRGCKWQDMDFYDGYQKLRLVPKRNIGDCVFLVVQPKGLGEPSLQ
jgi:hypothetical protein